MSAIADDLATILSTDDFGEVATYTPSGGSASSVTGIFDDEDIEVGDGEVSRLVHQTKFQCKSTDVTGIAEGDALVVRTVAYTIEYFKDDGTGVIDLFLSKD